MRGGRGGASEVLEVWKVLRVFVIWLDVACGCVEFLAAITVQRRGGCNGFSLDEKFEIFRFLSFSAISAEKGSKKLRLTRVTDDSDWSIERSLASSEKS